MTVVRPTDGDLRPDEVAGPPVTPAPRHGTGGRSRRRRRERRRRRRALLLRGTAGVVVLALAAVAIWAAAGGDDDPARPPPGPATEAAPSAPTATGTALLVQQGDGGEATGLTLLAPAGAGGGHVLLLPPGTMTEVPAFGLEAVGRALRHGGVPLLQATVENVLGVGIDEVVLLDAATLTALVEPAGDLTVDVPERVEEIGADGRVSVLWDPGEQLVSPLDVPRLLSDKGDGTDLARLARQQAFWRAWLDHLQRAADVRPAPEAAGGAGRFVRELAAGEHRVELLPVKAVDAGADGDVYQVREAELEALVRRALPGAGDLTQSGRIRVQVLNGTGAVGLAREVTVRLVQPPTRARVLFTGNADRFDHEVTEVVFYDRSQQPAAERVRTALGVGRLVLSRRPIDVVDVTVVVGRDFAVPGVGQP